jgi:hypothetical protein
MDIFCENHIKTIENPLGTDCAAYMAEGRCFKCPYTVNNLKYEPDFHHESILSIRFDKPPGMAADGVCRNFEPLKGIENDLIEIAKKNMEKIL